MKVLPDTVLKLYQMKEAHNIEAEGKQQRTEFFSALLPWKIIFLIKSRKHIRSKYKAAKEDDVLSVQLLQEKVKTLNKINETQNIQA